MLVASRNPKKLAELRRVLDAASLSGLTLVSLDDVPPFDEAPETGATFEDNALAKARDGFAATGLPSVADDSGLEVAALNGMPGVLSARWSGTHGDDAGNTALLLAQLREVPDERRFVPPGGGGLVTPPPPPPPPPRHAWPYVLSGLARRLLNNPSSPGHITTFLGSAVRQCISSSRHCRSRGRSAKREHQRYVRHSAAGHGNKCQ